MTRDQTQLSFSESDLFTLGVELEFQIIDQETMALRSQAAEMFQSAPSILAPRLSQEFLRSILEVQTGICFSLRDVENDLLQTCAYAEELAAEQRCLLYSGSLHPFSHPKDQELTDNERYEIIMEEMQQVGRDFMAQGLHVHVGVGSGDRAISVCNGLQIYLPLLLALSGSSPFFKGVDTGFSSYRTKLFEVFPLAGMYEYSPDWCNFLNRIRFLQQCKIIGGIRDLWWDVRPNPDFGTVEVRICDLPVSFNGVLALTACIQALVATLILEKTESHKLNRQVYEFNKWQAARHGLEGEYVYTSADSSERMPIKEALLRLVDRIQPASIRLGSESYLQRLQSILNEGNGSQKIRNLYAATGDWVQTIQTVQQEFWK